MVYLLDSNVFIQAHQTSYPFDVVTSFWNKLIELSNNGKIRSIDKVKKEICGSSTPDQLSIWLETKIGADFFVDSSPCVDTYAEIAVWTNDSDQYLQSAKDEFLQTDLADPWLIAYAKKNGCVIVTHETSNPNSKKKIKIPEPCIHFGVKFIRPIDMFRELNETF